jgi:hypothetical protein
MAINLPLTEIASREERTWRANIETPVTGNYGIQVYREIVDKDADGKVINVTKKAGVVDRLASAIAEESVTLPGGGGTVTAQQILAALPLFFDRWATEDAEAAAAAAVPVVPAPPPEEPPPEGLMQTRTASAPPAPRATKRETKRASKRTKR